MPPEYVVNGTARHVGESNQDRYVVRWYGYILADKTVKLPDYILQQSFTYYRRRVQKDDAVPQRRERAHIIRERTVQKSTK